MLRQLQAAFEVEFGCLHDAPLKLTLKSVTKFTPASIALLKFEHCAERLCDGFLR
jgi:hypothetical protein